MDDWPDCALEGCPRKSCLALESVYCFPHTNGNQHVKRWKIEARNGVSSIVSPLGDGGFLVEGGAVPWSGANDPSKW